MIVNRKTAVQVQTASKALSLPLLCHNT